MWVGTAVQPVSPGLPHLALSAALLAACSDYGFNHPSGEQPGETGPAEGAPRIVLEPASHDFGTLSPGALDTVEVTIANEGDADLVVNSVAHDGGQGSFSLELLDSVNGGLPWTLPPGDAADVAVHFSPTQTTVERGTLYVGSNDAQQPTAEAVQDGAARDFEGFMTGWYVLDDGVAYETTSNGDRVIDHHGDTDLYWYEPSGVHGLLDSTDVEADFAVMRQYVLDRVVAPVLPTGPFDWDEDSTLATFEYATFTYFMCDFWLSADADPSRFEISSGAVDDGIQVMVNGEILGQIKLNQSGSWPLENAVAGQVNTLIIILVDDSASDKYVHDLAFYEDGVLVEG